MSPLVNLDILFLYKSAVGDVGLIHLPARLKWLGLADTKVTGVGLPAISRLTRLENLNLCGDAVSDAGLEHLEGLQKLKILGA